MKEDDVWSNPINIIKKPVKLRKIEKSRKETIVSLPTLSKEQAERVKKHEEFLEKNKNKEYKYTFDD